MADNTLSKILMRRVVELAYKNNLSHIGSSLSVVDLIDTIYSQKKITDRFVLSNGHAALGLYAVLEKFNLIKSADSEKLLVHPDRHPELHIDVSTGSLGQGLPIAVGLALADRNRTVYCLTSDGELSEGSIWESFRILQEQRLSNLTIAISANGWGALDPIDVDILRRRLIGFGFRVYDVDGHNSGQISSALQSIPLQFPSLIFARTHQSPLPFLNGLDGHYQVLSETDYQLAMGTLHD